MGTAPKLPAGDARVTFGASSWRMLAGVRLFKQAGLPRRFGSPDENVPVTAG
jgi:hypothetical protein